MIKFLFVIAFFLLNMAACEPEPGPNAEPRHLRLGFHRGYGYRGYGHLRGHYYGKRSAEAEPRYGYYGLHRGYGYHGYGYLRGHYYGKRSAEAEPRYGYFGLRRGYGYLGYG